MTLLPLLFCKTVPGVLEKLPQLQCLHNYFINDLSPVYLVQKKQLHLVSQNFVLDQTRKTYVVYFCFSSLSQKKILAHQRELFFLDQIYRTQVQTPRLRFRCLRATLYYLMLIQAQKVHVTCNAKNLLRILAKYLYPTQSIRNFYFKILKSSLGTIQI